MYICRNVKYRLMGIFITFFLCQKVLKEKNLVKSNKNDPNFFFFFNVGCSLIHTLIARIIYLRVIYFLLVCVTSAEDFFFFCLAEGNKYS